MREAIFRDGERGMSVEQTLARWGEGKESWNAWAEDLLAPQIAADRGGVVVC